MDAWLTPHGQVLVAWKPASAARLPNGDQVATFTFLLLERGAIVREYDWRQSSLEDWLYTSAYFVSDGALKCCFLGERDSGRETNQVSIELDGLVATHAPTTDELLALVGARDAKANEVRVAALAVQQARLDGFARALRDVPGTDALLLTFSLDGTDWVVRHGTVEWWRDGTWPWLGKGLRDQLAPVVTRRYAPRRATLEVDDATWRSLSYAND